ncbi:MAG: hypothetical protein H6698_02635 [Myxococcales bacterium]|nr:hypothetical protein [Myxococcales bacterium]MCB9519883.1 hypothetical protein [Myxococcales bacterium]MCB9533210.1 hypothetical protein [Myxococcales bacterium]
MCSRNEKAQDFDGKPMNSTVQLVRCALALPVALVMGTAACGGTQTPDTPSEESVVRPPRVRYGTLDATSGRAERFDLNHDGQPDQYRGSGWAARDVNFDGRLDLYEYFDGPTLVEQELELDFDGQIDLVRVYANGVLTRKEFYTDGPRRPSMLKYYDTNGDVLRVERDTDNDGVMDFFGYYEGNQLVRVGIDLDRDGSPDDIEPLN